MDLVVSLVEILGLVLGVLDLVLEVPGLVPLQVFECDCSFKQKVIKLLLCPCKNFMYQISNTLEQQLRSNPVATILSGSKDADKAGLYNSSCRLRIRNLHYLRKNLQYKSSNFLMYSNMFA